jgi:hypothetical protein
MSEQMTLQRYQEIKAELDTAKANEMEARLALVARSGHTVKGSKTVVLDGFKVAVTNTVNTSVFLPGLDNAREVLGEEKFNAVFKIKYEVSATGLKALSGEELEAAEDAIVTKPGTPSLEIKKAV